MNYLDNEKYRDSIRIAIRETIDFGNFYGKSILILGASGLVCSFLVDMFLLANQEQEANITVYAAGRSREGLDKRFGIETEFLHFVVADVCNLDLDETFDFIIHGASFGHPQAFVDEHVEVLLSNVVGVKNVCELARRNIACKVLYISSGEAAADVDNLSVRACYPIGKKAAETLCISYASEYGVDVRIARLSHTFGPNYKDVDNRASTQFIDDAVMNREIVLHSKGQQVRSYTYVADSASGLLTALSVGKKGHMYNVASDESCNILEFAQMCANVSGNEVRIELPSEEQAKQATPISRQIMENDALKSWGWKPWFSIKQGIVDSILIRKEIQC